MKNLFRTIISRLTRRSNEEIKALEEFLNNAYKENSLSPEEAKKNLEQGLIEIEVDGKHSSNGLLITNDGYFLTSRHCVDDGIEEAKIKLHDGSTYKIDRECIHNKLEDIALAKAEIPVKPSPRAYSFHTEEMNEQTPLRLMTRRRGLLVDNYGFVDKKYKGYFFVHHLVNAFKQNFHYGDGNISLNFVTKKGDSGGILIDSDYKVIGILWGGSPEQIDRLGLATKSIKALELVKYYKEHYKKKH